MSSASRSCSPVLAALFALSAANVASAQQAAAPADRCSGTLCDLYYGGPAAESQPGAKAAAPRPVTVPQGGLLGMFSGAPSEPAAPGGPPAPRRLVGVGGGGLSAMARGEAPERCSGTLCDLYYGGPAPEKPEPQAAPATEQHATAIDTTADEPAQPAIRYRPMPREKPLCAPRPGDPWSCYRK